MINVITNPANFPIDTHLQAKATSSSFFNIVKNIFAFIADRFYRLYNCTHLLFDRIIHPFRQPQRDVKTVVNKMNLSWGANTSVTATNLHTALTEATQQICNNISYTANVHHRFRDVGCPEKTAVGDKLHANRVDLGANHKTVLTQMPLPNEAGLPFWSFASKNEPHWVLDLTQDQEGPSGYHHLPSDVRCIQQEQFDQNYRNFLISTYQMGDAQVNRLRFPNWVDRDAISVKELKQILNVMGKKAGENTEWIVHCKAGVGRTGTVVIARALAHLDRQGLLTRENLLQTISELILMGRQQRGTGCVQSTVQLKLLIDFGLALIDNSFWFKIPNPISIGRNLFHRLQG